MRAVPPPRPSEYQPLPAFALVENVDHLFARYPQLHALGYGTCPGAPAPHDVAAMITTMMSVLSTYSVSSHTVTLLTFACIWKSKNRMVFYRVILGIDAIIASMIYHLKLWTHHATRRVDIEPKLL